MRIVRAPSRIAPQLPRTPSSEPTEKAMFSTLLDKLLYRTNRPTKRLAGGRRAAHPRSRPKYRPLLDQLEDRTLMSGSSLVQAANTYGQIPLSFEANQGQTDAAVQFLPR